MSPLCVIDEARLIACVCGVDREGFGHSLAKCEDIAPTSVLCDITLDNSEE